MFRQERKKCSLFLLLMSQTKTGCRWNCSAVWLQSTDLISSMNLQTMALCKKGEKIRNESSTKVHHQPHHEFIHPTCSCRLFQCLAFMTSWTLLNVAHNYCNVEEKGNPDWIIFSLIWFCHSAFCTVITSTATVLKIHLQFKIDK